MRPGRRARRRYLLQVCAEMKREQSWHRIPGWRYAVEFKHDPGLRPYQRTALQRTQEQFYRGFYQ